MSERPLSQSNSDNAQHSSHADVSSTVVVSVWRAHSTPVTETRPLADCSCDQLEREHTPSEPNEESILLQDDQNESNTKASTEDEPGLKPPSLYSSRPISQKPDLRDVNFGHIELLSPWFPRVDPEYDRARGFWSWRIWHSRRDIVLWIAFMISVSVLIANVVIVAVLGSKHGISSNRGLIKLYEGDCERVKYLGISAHVGINILSTLLLGTSNLCMQLLVAPTREEIDAAHRRKVWLDVGIQSWRNLTNIKPSRKWIWIMLLLSSIPLHFIYNSAISTSIPQYGYPTIVASESFVHGTDYDIGNWTNITSVGVSELGYNRWPPTRLWNGTQGFLGIQADANNTLIYERLENKQCIEKYADVFSARSSLVVVTENLPGDQNASVHQYIYWSAQYGGFSRYNPCNSGDSWPNNPTCHDVLDNTPEQYENWHRFNRTVLYCLRKRIDDHCRINYSPGIFIAVCCFSFVKCACILGTIILHRKPTISTIGDAIASFLEYADETSAHMGPVAKSTFVKPAFAESNSKAWEEPSTIAWRPCTTRWYSAPSRRRWIITMSLCTLTVATALGCGIAGAKGSQKRLQSMTFAWEMRQSIGVPNPNAFMNYFLPRYGAKGFIANVVFANIMQVVISFLYLAYNALLTCMLVSDEWSRFTRHRKTLRVTHPRGIQRSTYFISMPYKYGVPLMFANTVLHTLISQSMFIISTIAYYPNFVEDPYNSYTVTGYSTSAIIISICVGTSTLLTLIGISFVKVDNNIPLASTCSIAISAACHRPAEDTDAHLLPVRWGVVSHEREIPVRCSFTTLRGVRSPRSGEIIGGERMQCDVDWVETPLSRMDRALRCLMKPFGRWVSTKRKKRKEG